MLEESKKHIEKSKKTDKHFIKGNYLINCFLKD